MADKFSRRDFLKVAGLGLGALAFKPYKDNNERDTPRSQSSRIIGSYMDAIRKEYPDQNTNSIDAYSSRVTGSFTNILNNEITSLIYGDSELATNQLFEIDWIGEYDSPCLHAETKPSTEAAIINIYNKTYFAYSNQKDGFRLFDITSLSANLELSLHKGGVIRRRTTIDNNREAVELYKIDGNKFSIFDKEIIGRKHKHYNDITLDTKDEQTKNRNKMLEMTDGQMAFITTNDDVPQLEIIRSNGNKIITLEGYIPNLLHNNLQKDIFVLGDTVGYMATDKIDSERQPQVIFILKKGNTNYGEILGLSTDNFLNTRTLLKFNFTLNSKAEPTGQHGQIGTLSLKDLDDIHWSTLFEIKMNQKDLTCALNNDTISVIQTITGPDVLNDTSIRSYDL